MTSEHEREHDDDLDSAGWNYWEDLGEDDPEAHYGDEAQAYAELPWWRRARVRWAWWRSGARSRRHWRRELRALPREQRRAIRRGTAPLPPHLEAPF